MKGAFNTDIFWDSARTYQKGSPIDVCENAYEFVKRYGFTFDGEEFDWVKYKHLIEVYEDNHPEITLMAGAQTGKSLRLMVALLRLGIALWGGLYGYYFPDFFLPKAFSKERFKPFVLSSKELAPWLGAESTKGKGSDAVLSRSFGPSTFFFLSVGGKTATEGLPMPGVFFDEVRRMGLGDIQRAVKRTSSYESPVIWRVSTARYPESDIHAAFLSGDQRYFHSDCACPDGIVLALRFPDCIVDLRGVSAELRERVAKAYEDAGMSYLGLDTRERERWLECCYMCPDCGTVITDPREGWWEAENPKAYAHSYHMPQLLTMPAGRVWKEYAEPDEPLDIMEFYNSTLGLPYISKEARYAVLEQLLACVEYEMAWPANKSEDWRRAHLKNTAMGIDQMGEFNCVVIKAVMPNGKYGTVHIEVTYGKNTWRRCGELMAEYDVRYCVADQNPNFNDARKFAKLFKGRVYLVSYSDDGKGKSDMIDWKDSQHKKGQKGKETKFKWKVAINRSRALEWSLSRWKDRLNIVPDPTKLIQELPRQAGKVMLTPGMEVGQWEPVPICRDVYFPHMLRMVRRKVVINEEHQRQGDYKMVAEYIGSEDPHFVFANLFADVACARIGIPSGVRRI